jgi:UDP-N-acetylglucosamine 2-epimerase (non-hydrolysing)
MKILTILGTRPEIIRLSRIIPKLDSLCDHVLAHTGQNFDPRLNDIFFDELGVRSADHTFESAGDSFGAQVGQILASTDKLVRREKPDRLLVLGDTDSALSAVVAKRSGIPVYHMEAGNRCYDDRVPEEVNRRIIDHCSDVLLPYTDRSRQNLLREGIAGERIYVTGNPINEVIQHYDDRLRLAGVLQRLGLQPKEYFLVTLHRAENVDIPERLKAFTESFELLQRKYDMPVIISTHPRTRSRMPMFDVNIENAQLRFLPPFGFFDFISLERNAFCVLSDSGTVQEECAIFGVPNVTLRDVTERPETIECGSNMLSGARPDSILDCVHTVLAQKRPWKAPPEYLVENVSDIVTKIVLGYRPTRGPESLS